MTGRRFRFAACTRDRHTRCAGVFGSHADADALGRATEFGRPCYCTCPCHHEESR